MRTLIRSLIISGALAITSTACVMEEDFADEDLVDETAAQVPSAFQHGIYYDDYLAAKTDEAESEGVSKCVITGMHRKYAAGGALLADKYICPNAASRSSGGIGISRIDKFVGDIYSRFPGWFHGAQYQVDAALGGKQVYSWGGSWGGNTWWHAKSVVVDGLSYQQCKNLRNNWVNVSTVARTQAQHPSCRLYFKWFSGN